MRLLGAVLCSFVAVSLAAAQSAKQNAPEVKAPAPETRKVKTIPLNAEGAPKTEAKEQSKAQPKEQPKTEAKEQPKAKAAAKGKKGNEKSEISRAMLDSYAAIPLAERIAIQSDLIWTGDYNGIVSGDFGDRAVAAVKSFQKRNGGKETGILNQPERAALAASAKPKQDAVGWRMVDDGASGARIGIPGKLVPQQSTIVGGTRWASSRGEYSVESFRIVQPGTTLAATFDRMKREPAGRKTEYSVMRDNFFVISGMQNLKRFYVRGQIRGEEVRGITVLYDQAMAGIMEPVVVAMSSAYAAFPSSIAPPPRRKVEYASGVAVGPGYIVTSREALEGCYVVTIGGIGGADRVAEDKANGLALLRVHGAELKPIALAADTAKPAEVTLVGIADPQQQGGGRAVSNVKARLADTLVEPAPAAGFAGAGAFFGSDAKLLGIVNVKDAQAGVTGQPQATLVSADAIRALLASNKIAPAAGGTAEVAKDSVVRVICVRK